MMSRIILLLFVHLATVCVQCRGYSLSYLVEDQNTSPAIQAVKLLLQQLHVQQHPPKAACRNQRLLIVQFINSFEGLGSILKLVTLGLAEAAHSNRTLIFGLHPLPHMFEKSRDEWFNKKTATGKHKVMIKGMEFDCGYDENDVGYDGSGPYACFFQPLSSCTVKDISISELIELGKNGYDDNARVKIQEERRAPAAYQYPVHNPLYSTLFETLPSNIRHKWAGSLSAYVFRLKPDVLAMFEKRRMDLWPIHLGTSCQCTIINTICRHNLFTSAVKITSFLTLYSPTLLTCPPTCLINPTFISIH